MKRRYSKNAYRHIMKFVAPLPVELAHLWYARDYSGAGTTMRSRRGPDYSFSVAGPMYDDAGNSVGAIPVVHHDAAGNIRGVWGGPVFSNIFTSVTPTAETKSLTAQKYCLQVFGLGASATCSYGTATPGSPLIFTASAGSTTFTPTDCAKWMLSAVGGFVFPYVPPGTSVVSAAGTTGGNGASLTLDQRLTEAFRGKVDGVELAGSDLTGWANSGILATHTSNTIVTTGGSAGIVFGPFTTGDRILVDIRGTSTAGLTVNSADGLSPTARTELMAGFGKVEWTVAADKRYLYLRHGSDGTSSNVSFSIQRLLPATYTIAALTCMGVGSGELALDTTIGILSTGASPALLYTKRTATDQEFHVLSLDGVNCAISSPGTDVWNRDEIHLKVVQTNSAGTQFRVGNRRYNLDKTPINASITWGTWITFDGSFSPLSYLRWFLNGTVPIWQRAVAIWDKGAIADSEILKRMEPA